MSKNFHHYLYSEKLKSSLKSAGIYDLITGFYWSFNRIVSKGKIVDEKQGVSAEFVTENAADFRSMVHKLESEDPVISDMLDYMKSEDVFYDVGAQNGMFSIFASGKLEETSIFAFDPSPENKEAMERNLEENDCDIKIFELALSNENTQVSYSFNEPDKPTRNGNILGRNSDKSDSITVDARTGDSLISEEELPEPNVIKIDVEGAEMKVLEGLESAISNEECRSIYLEIHDSVLSEQDIEYIYSFLKEKGFEIQTLYERANTGIKAYR